MQRASLAAVLFLGLAACAPDRHATEPAATPFAGQQTLTIDQTTGVIRAPDAADLEALGASFEARSPSSDDGLVEIVSPVDGGGVLVDLQGRYRSAFSVSIGDDGQLIGDCAVPHCSKH
jgi:hypothetical protein